MARVFQAYPKNTAESFHSQELGSGKPQIHSLVEVDGRRFDIARIFNSQATFEKPLLIINL